MGGAEEFVERLPEGFGTYLERPVRDYYSALPEGTTSLFGRAVDYGRIRSIGKMEASSSKSLSGGQMQRIALQVVFFSSIFTMLKPFTQVENIHAFSCVPAQGGPPAL